MKRRKFGAVLFSLFIFHFSLDFAHAESVSQTFMLQPGWNAVFLEVEPESTAPADVFAGITDLQSVWMWNPRTSTVEYIQNPDMLVPESPQWMVYFPNDPVLSNLFAIHGETAYLIHLGGTTDVTWTVTGEPCIPRIDWKANSFNFIGFHLNQEEAPFFSDFFSTSLAHKGQEIYVLDNATAAWTKVTDPSLRMRHGEGFWVYCKGHSEFAGPVSVQLEQGTGLHYGTTLVEQDLRVFNNAVRAKTVSLKVSSPDVQLHYWLFDPANNVAEWVPFPTDAPLDLAIAAGEKQKLRVGARRAGLNAGTTYAANVEVTDGEGMRILLPVSVTGIDYAGLWVGDTTIRKVSEARISDTPVPTGSEFSFRLIVHVDESGSAHLLREVIQLWQEGTWKPDPNALGKLIPDEPGRFVLIANDALIPNYSGAALRDGQPVGRRISSPAFGFSGPQEMTGAFQLGSNLTLPLPLELLPGDPTNPFRHKYHPDHKLPEQSYQVTRDITLAFRDKDDEGKPITGVPILSWGSTDVGGIYKETISGLHKKDIYIEGTFVLHKVSDVGTLTR